jgi:hypothetical protein
MSKEIIDSLSPEDIEQLETAIKSYYEYNTEYNSIKKDKDVFNTLIKEILKKNNLTKFSTEEGLNASLTITNKPVYNELGLIEYLKQFNIPDLIKTKEYIDMDVLEDCIYHGQIDAANLAPYKEDKITETLRVSKSKLLKG